MNSHYSRKNKPQSKKTVAVPTKHIKTGFTALQKTIALIGSILSIIVATITITKVLHPNTETKKDKVDHSTSTIVKIIEKDNSSSTVNTDLSHSSSSAIPESSTNTQTSSSSENPAAKTDTSTSTAPTTNTGASTNTSTTP